MFTKEYPLQQEELQECAVNFPYFCETYVKIVRPQGTQNCGLVPLKLYDYQHRLYNHLEDHRFTTFSKFRQGGFSTLCGIYALWRCMFRLDEQILYLGTSDRAAVDVGHQVVDRAVQYFPDWLTPSKKGKWNDHMKEFPETGSRIMFYTPEAACGKAVSHLFVDEASFIRDMDRHWKAMWPTISTGGKATVFSTPNSTQDWFWKNLKDAENGLNNWTVYGCHYTENDEFADPRWEQQMRQNLGEKGWQSEVCQEAHHAPAPYTPKTKYIPMPPRQITDPWEVSWDKNKLLKEFGW